MPMTATRARFTPVEPDRTQTQEVLAKPLRQQFAAEYKRWVVDEAKALKGDPGKIGALCGSA